MGVPTSFWAADYPHLEYNLAVVFIQLHPLYFRHLIQLVKPLQNSNLVFQWHFKERSFYQWVLNP